MGAVNGVSAYCRLEGLCGAGVVSFCSRLVTMIAAVAQKLVRQEFAGPLAQVDSPRPGKRRPPRLVDALPHPGLETNPFEAVIRKALTCLHCVV